MQNILSHKKQLNKNKKELEFEEKRAEAFKQFMKAHIADPLFQECVGKIYLQEELMLQI